MIFRSLPLVFCLFLTLFAGRISAQNESVLVQVNLSNPSIYPEDLAKPGVATVSVTLLDNRAQFTGVLRLTLHDQSGRQIATPLDGRVRTETLFRGQTRVFTGAELAYYTNLLGADAGAGLGGRGSVLQEGEITLCAEFYAPNFLSQPLSNVACDGGYAELHAPPTELRPEGEVIAIDRDMDAVNFYWSPQYFGGPVDYYLTIWKLDDIWRGSPDIVISSFDPIRPPLKVVPTGSFTQLWTHAEANLEPGNTYLYQVRAVDPTGRARFRNDGYSAPQTFDYKTPLVFGDQLCYTPEALALAGSTGAYSLGWTGQPLNDVRHSVSVYSLPERELVLLSELETTPTFPQRRLIGRGPNVRFSYPLGVPLDTTGGRAYELQLCSVCPLTGELNCLETVLGTPRSGDGGGGGTDGPVGPGVVVDPGGETVAADDNDQEGTDEPGDDTIVSPCFVISQPTMTVAVQGPTSVDLSWSTQGFSSGGQYELTYQPTSQLGEVPDTLTFPTGSSGTTINDLNASTAYRFNLCATCPDGQRQCRQVKAKTNPYGCPESPDLLAGVTVSALPPDGIGVDWSAFGDTDLAGWRAFINDGTDPLAQQNLAFATDRGPAAAPASTTFSDLATDSEYTVTVCYRCADGTTNCADFAVELVGCDALALELTPGEVGFDEATFDWLATAEGVYRVAYEQPGNGTNDDFFEVTDNAHTISGLQPLTTYEVIVCAPCGSAAVCDTVSITTEKVTCRDAGEYSYDYNCGTAGDYEELDLGTRITDLAPGDSIWAGDFLVEVASVDPAGNKFDGYGFTKVPYLNGAKIRLDFEQVEVNENCRMVAGQMVVISPVTAALEQIQGAMAGFMDLLADIDQFLGQISQALGMIGDVLNELADDVERYDEITAVVDAAVDAVAQIPYIPEDLLSDLDDAADCMRAAALSGDETAMAACNDQFQEALDAIKEFTDVLFDAPFQVEFEPAAGQTVTYGFDKQQYVSIPTPYVTHTIAGEAYKVPWISTSTKAGREGHAVAASRADGGSLDGVSFVETSTDPIAGWTVSGATASHPDLSAAGDQRVRHVFATVPGDTTGGKPPVRIAGQVSMVTYDPVEVTVHIVPVNGAALPYAAADREALQTRLNEIYHPAVVDLTVAIEPNLDAPDFGGTLSEIDLHPLSNYTPEMLALRRLVRQQDYHNGDDYYLMVVGGMEPAGREGFMPRKRRYGFINADQATDQATFARVAAHELAHGAYHLQHPFNQFPNAAEGETDNLMDYAGGERLIRYQWGEVHDPVANFSLFDEVGEGESVVVDDQFTPSISSKFAKALSDLVCKSFHTWEGGAINTAEAINFLIPNHSHGNWELGGIIFYSSGQQFDLDLTIYAARPTATALDNGNSILEWSGPNNNFFRTICNSQDTSIVIDWFEGGHETLFNSQINELRTLGSENNLFSHLYELSRCAMEMLSGDERISYINNLLNDINVDTEQEAIIGRIFEETLDDQNRFVFGQLLDSYSNYNSLFEKVDDNPNAFNSILKGTLNAFWSFRPQYKPSPFEGQGTGDEDIDLSLNLQVQTGGLTNSTISNVTAHQLTNGYLQFTNTVNWYYMVGELAMFSETIEISDYQKIKPMSPVGLHIGPGHRDLGFSNGQYAGIVPASFAAGLAIRQSEQIEEQAIGLTFDVALMSLGIGELNLAFRTWQTARTLKNIARLTLAVADISAGMLDITCGVSEDSELCKEWQKVSMYVQLGLLSVSAADQIDDLVTRTVRSADNIALILSRIEDLLPDEAARVLFRADWDANAEGFRDYFLLASNNNLSNRIQNYRNISDLPAHIRRNSDILTVSDDLRRNGFTNTQIRTLATLENAEALRVAGRLNTAHGVDHIRATRMTDNAYVLGEEVGESLSVITQGPGRLNGNFNQLDNQLEDAIGSPLREKHGIVLTLDSGADKVRQGKTIEIENGHADLEDLTSSISYQQKYVSGGSTAVRNNLSSATNQLRGSGGEYPQFQERVAHIRTHPDCTSPERNMTYDQLVNKMREYNGYNVNFTDISSIVIENSTGVHNIPVSLIVN